MNEVIKSNVIIDFVGQTKAASYLRCSRSTITKYKDTDKPYKGYIIKSILPS